jgi:hypothetical protein
LIRYSKPDYLRSPNEKGPYYDPFEDYGIDSDPVPPKIDPDDHSAKREIPKDVWDCFAATRIDRQRLQEGNFTALRGYWSLNILALPSRLQEVSNWIRKVANQPAAAWWAASQAGVHPHLQDRILFELERSGKVSSPEVRRAWHYIFKAWEPRKDFHHEWYRLKKSIGLDGWTDATIRELALISRPYLKVERPYWSGPKPPKNRENIPLKNMVDLNIEYPRIEKNIQIPDEYIIIAAREFRKGLEYTIILNKELGDRGPHLFCSIEPESDSESEPFERTYGFSSIFLFYVDLLKRLIEKDTKAAKQEYLGWWTHEEKIFARLTIWAAGNQSLLSGTEAGQLICNLNDEIFWDRGHQRDLLLVLTKRWGDFPVALRRKIEKRLLRGPVREDEEELNEYVERRSSFSLNRIHWLAANSCQLTLDLEAESIKLRKLAPQWKPPCANEAAVASEEARVDWIQTDMDFSALLSEPLATLLSKAVEISGGTDNFFKQSDPFAGLAREQPELAFAALEYSAKNHKYPEWAWRKLLNPEARKSDKPIFSAQISVSLARLPIRAIA